MKNFVVANTKGGVGKSVISTMVLPLLQQDKKVTIYEIDDNNKTVLPNSKIKIETIKVENEKIDGIVFDLLAGDDKVNIIDAGGGNDTNSVLKYIQDLEIPVEKYFVPINDDIEQVQNAVFTIEKIREIDAAASISLVLNRCQELDEKSIENQFVGVFGSEDFGLPEKLDDLGISSEVDLLVVKNSPLFSILKSKGVALTDVFETSKDLVDNFQDYRSAWAKEGKEVFSKKMKEWRLAKKIKEIGDEILKIFGEKR